MKNIISFMLRFEMKLFLIVGVVFILLKVTGIVK